MLFSSVCYFCGDTLVPVLAWHPGQLLASPPVNPAQILRKKRPGCSKPFTSMTPVTYKKFLFRSGLYPFNKEICFMFHSYQDVAVKCVAEWGLCSVLYLQMTGKWWWPRATSALLLSELAKTARCLGHLSGPAPTRAILSWTRLWVFCLASVGEAFSTDMLLVAFTWMCPGREVC